MPVSPGSHALFSVRTVHVPPNKKAIPFELRCEHARQEVWMAYMVARIGIAPMSAEGMNLAIYY